MFQVILTFESTHKVLKAEKLVKKYGIDHEMIPTPRDLSSNCGMSIRILDESIKKEQLEKIFGEHNLSVNVFLRNGDIKNNKKDKP